MKKSYLAFMTVLAGLTLTTAAQTPQPPQPAQPTSLEFDFSSRPPAVGQTRVLPTDNYTKQRGYGFEPGAKLHTNGTDISSDHPFFFSAAVPEGNYLVTVTFGDASSASDNTVFAELRRLMVENAHTDPGVFAPATFLVNVRRPPIAGTTKSVRLTDREKSTEAWAWDDRLTLEFNGAHPAVAAVEIEKAALPTLFIMGDSTVCDQPREPFNSWGQMITRFIKPDIAVSNQAESGESLAGALAKGRLDKIWADMKSGDYLLMQFGHNDMKSRAPNALDTFTNDLRHVVDETRGHGGTIILLTPVSRRTFNDQGKIINSFNGYPDATKLVATEKNVPLIDLQSLAAAFYESMGPDASHRAFANPRENTHHSDYGSYEIAQCVLKGLKQLNLPLADHIIDDFKPFDPAHPDRFEDFKIPHSILVTDQTPLGN